MRRLGAVTIMAVILACSASASAVTLNDTFSTNPYGTPKRWCERYHHVHWDAINLLFSGINGTTCPTPVDTTGCCSTCPTAGCVSVLAAGGHFAITPINYTGLTRSAEYKFAFQAPLTGGEHPNLYIVSHPNCHLGFQAVIFRDVGNSYYLRMIRTADPDGVHPECDGYAQELSNQVFFSNPALTTLPRFKLRFSTQPHATLPGSLIVGNASLTDTVTGVVYTAPTKNFGRPAWYNNQARRFGLGGVLANGSVYPFDNFIGTAN